MAKLELENVSYVYGAGTPFCITALKDINISFGENKITGIIGHTGSGKSTLTQLFNGLIKPETGVVRLDGMDIWEDPKAISKIRHRIGLVFQYPEYQLFEETVEKDIAFGPVNMKKTPEQVKLLVEQAADFTGIPKSMLCMSPFELSGGQKRRVAIAGVIAMDPDILVLDEPAAGLDPGGREEILGRIKAYRDKKNKTVILISHSMEDMAKYAEELVVMKNGTVIMHDTVAEVFKRTDLIEETGLSVPRITKLMKRLKKDGYPVSDSVYTVEAAYNEIMNVLNKQ
ncbi:MAG: energy-coupling factor transporter ATPase [Ruminococcaceae bacterium]|nr:energy-coupling factor transporter ATPase [Oscillospiraceae bacterium]